MLSIVPRKVQNAIILDIKGRLDTQTSGTFEKETQSIIEGSEGRLLLNCADLEYVSSAGLRVFLILSRKPGLKLALFAVRPPIAEVIKLTGLQALFPIYETEEEALAAA